MEDDDRPFGECVLCGGPIQYGEPILCYEEGKIAHRMNTWCKAYRESVARGDEKICKDMGIVLD